MTTQTFYLLCMGLIVLTTAWADSCKSIPAFKGNQTLSDTVLESDSYAYFYYTSYGPFTVELDSSVHGFQMFISKDDMKPTSDSDQVQFSSLTSPLGLYIEVNASDSKSQCWAISVYSPSTVQPGSRFELVFSSRYDKLVGECKRKHAEIESEITDSNIDFAEQSVSYNGYVYYYFSAKANHRVTFALQPESGDPDLYLSQSTFSLAPKAGSKEHQWPSSSMGSADSLTLSTGSVPECYVVGVYGYTESSFTLRIVSEEMDKKVNLVLIMLSVFVPVFALVFASLLIWKRVYGIRKVPEVVKADTEVGEEEPPSGQAKRTESRVPATSSTPSDVAKSQFGV